jgi:hypothetical protein
MATLHELPEWETNEKKTSFFSRASNPFAKTNPFLTAGESATQNAGGHKESNWSRRSPRTQTVDVDKEEGEIMESDTVSHENGPVEVGESAGIGAAPGRGLSPSWQRGRFLGRSRRTWLIGLVVAIVLIALIIGLAVGLKHKSYVGLNTFVPTTPI